MSLKTTVLFLFAFTTFNAFSQDPCPGMLIYPMASANQFPTAANGICNTRDSVNIQAYYNGSMGLWSSNGTGTFVDPASSLATYKFSALDKTKDSLHFTFTIDESARGCPIVSGTTTLYITPTPVINAGNDTLVCSFQGLDLPLHPLGPDAGVYYTWSTNSGGSFNPDYTKETIFDGTMIYSGLSKVALVLTLHAYCIVVDTIWVTERAQTISAAGGDLPACQRTIPIKRSSTNASSTLWSTAGTGKFTNPTQLENVYQASIQDSTLGSVKLYLDAFPKDDCPAVRDSLTLKFIAPVIHIPQRDSLYCINSIPLNSIQNVGTGMHWKTSGTGTFYFNGDIDYLGLVYTNYIPSAADFKSDHIQLTAIANNTNCPMAADSISITTKPPVKVSVTGEILSSGEVSLTGVVENAGGGIWSTSGTGTFASPTALSTTYTPSAKDIAQGVISFNLTSTDNGICASNYGGYYPTLTSFSLQANVDVQQNVLDYGTMVLYKKEAGKYLQLKQQLLDTLNFASFSGLVSGTYLLQLLPAAAYAGKYLPTYYKNSLTWEQADSVVINKQSLSGLSIGLVAYAPAAQVNGNDNISGQVNYGLPNTRIAAQLPKDKVIIYLSNVGGDIIAYTYTDASGNFQFTHIPSGSYQLRSEYPGYPANMQEVKVDGDPSTPSIVNFPATVTGSTTASSPVRFRVYPNPAKEYISMELAGASGNAVSIQVFDALGKLRLEKNDVSTASAYSLNIQELPEGVYFLKLMDGNSAQQSKFCKME